MYLLNFILVFRNANIRSFTGYVLYCQPHVTIRSDLEIIPRKKKKIRGIAQLIPNFCHSQASCLLPYPVQAKGRLGRKAHCEFLALCAPLSPAPCMRRACSISLWCTPQLSKDGLPGSGEKLEDPRKKRESCRFIPGLGRETDSEGWGRKKAEE